MGTISYGDPLTINEIKLKSDDTFSSDLVGSLGTRTGINIEVTATDVSSTTIDQTSVYVKSNITDSYGIIVWCLETGENTGIYRGVANIGTKSDWEESIVGASSGEVITIVSETDTTKKISASYGSATNLTEETGVPENYSLSQNYPNPFNPTTTIEYQIPTESKVLIVIYDLLGRKIKTLVNDTKIAGLYRIIWDGTNINNRTSASGVYLIKMDADNFKETRKLLLQR